MVSDITTIPEEKRRRGRPKGAHNKTAMTLKEAILQATESYECEGKTGMVAYLEELRDSYPKTFCTLLSRVLPLQVTTTNGQGKDVPIKLSVEIVKPE